MDGATGTIHFSSIKYFICFKSLYSNIFEFNELECVWKRDKIEYEKKNDCNY